MNHWQSLSRQITKYENQLARTIQQCGSLTLKLFVLQATESWAGPGDKSSRLSTHNKKNAAACD